tara:strand:- start:5453 stop:12940 length:7488 start_codon:yes stop_codon:yes gene_type:complete
MSLQTNTNISPYYDDFDPKKNFYRVMYKAGYPIQARELTTAQSIAQNQIETLASRLMKEGENVVPGEFGLAVPVSYVRASTITQGTTAQDFVSYTLTGATSGVIAQVNFATEETDDDDVTFYVNYVSSGATGEYNQFLEGETLESSNPNNYTASVGINTVSKPSSSEPIGQGSLFSVTEGAYFVDGFVVRNDASTITLDKYGIKPTYRVGFLVSEGFVTSVDDASLLDNAQGASNFAAPGADRLKITLTLAARDTETSDPNFITLANVDNGELIGSGKAGNTVKWDWLYDILARRTFDESGDYIVTEFKLGLQEYYNTEQVDGRFNPDPETNLYPPVPGSNSRTELTQSQADAKYVVRVDPGKAYVKGYEVGYKNAVYVYGDKPRETSFRSDSITQITEGNNVTVTNVYGTPDVQNLTGDGTSLAYDSIKIYRNFTDGFVGEGTDSNGRPLNLGNEPWKTYHVIADRSIAGTTTGLTEIFKEGNSAVVTSPTPLVRGSVIGTGVVLNSYEITPRLAGLLRPRYFMPEQLIDGNDGYYAYNSSYKMGMMSSQFFVEIPLIGVTEPAQEWVVGNLVTGEDSGATGIVEDGSSAERLYLSTTLGEFLEGEEVVQGNKVSSIKNKGKISGFSFTDKGTSSNTIDLSAETGIKLTAVGTDKTLTVAAGQIITSASKIELTSVGQVALADFPYPEGSSLNSKVSYAVETIPNGVKGYANIEAGIRKNNLAISKSFYSTLADTNDFSADISIQNNKDSLITDVANASLFSGEVGSNVLLCDNFSGDPTGEIFEGDLVTFVDDTGRSINKLVAFATQPVGYGSLRSKAAIYFTTTLPNAVTGKTVQRIRLQTKGNPRDNLIFQLPQSVISSLETNQEASSISYQIFREYILNLSGGDQVITISTGKNNETFISNESQTSIAIAENIANPSDPNRTEGRTITASSIDVTQDNGRKAVITLSSAIGSTSTIKVLIPVFVTDAIAKRKIFRQNQGLTITGDSALGSIVSLGRTDVYVVNQILMGPDKLNVTDNYRLDNGQRDNIYDISRLILKTGRPRATGNLELDYSYFEHSGDGDFFSADSYTDDNGIGFVAIPSYQPTAIIPNGSEFTNNVNLPLRDCVDFRPTVNTGGTQASSIAKITDGVDAQSAINFRDTTNGGNSSAPRMPIPGTQFQSDLEYYLPKFDSLFLDSRGALILTSGPSANKPVPPVTPSNAIRLYDLYCPPYTFTTKSINVKKFNYKRYRMKDIASIEARIDRVEDIVSLSLLEQSALNMNVRDAVTGLDRFKNGIVVDTFKDHGTGDTALEQYRCSIDANNNHLRSPHFTDQVELEDINMTFSQKRGNGYREDNGIVTCDYESLRFLQNPLATRFINLQPFSVFTYDGNMSLTPEIDTFQDVTRLPDLVIEDNTLFDAMVNLTGEMASSGMGTQWGSWETTGSSTSSSQTVIQNENGNNAAGTAAGIIAGLGGNVTVDANAAEQFELGGAPPLVITNETTSTTQQREQTQTTINVSTGSIQETSYGDRVVDVQLAETMRSIPILVQAYRTKPNTRYYAFFDDVDCTSWFSIDETTSDWPDGKNRYSGIPNENSKGFGYSLMSDDVGTLTGVFIVPNGRPPLANSSFDGTMENLQYQTEGSTRSFRTGTKTLRLTSSASNVKDESQVEGFAEADFTSSGVLLDKQETIVATRLPSFSSTTTVTGSETQVIESQETSANYFDPVAQTFQVDKTFTEGLFVTELDVFFRTKDETQGVEAYLVSTDGQVPTEAILPHSKVVKTSDSALRVIVTGSNETIPDGTTVVGQISGATGVVKSDTTFQDANGNSQTNITNSVYNLLLSNYNGEFVEGEIIKPEVSPESSNTYRIATKEYRVGRIDITQLGSGYTSATVAFSAPELPGGSSATATALVKDGMVYGINIDSVGSGYTQAPSITISGDGANAKATVRIVEGRDAIQMGVCTSEDATAATKFKFHAPIYLQSNTYYAFVVKAPTSLNFTIWTSKLGENQLDTELRVVEQPSLGSLFMSQNGGLWTEDQTQDVTFRLFRADFIPNAAANVVLQNAPINLQRTQDDPIETNVDGSDLTSEIFGDNPQVIRFYHYNHGFTKGDLISIIGVDNDPGGIPNASYNSLHTVIDSDFHTFTFNCGVSATRSEKTGGSAVLSSYQRPYEVLNVYTGAMTFGSSKLQAVNRGTTAAGVSGYDYDKRYQLDFQYYINLAESFYYPGARVVANYLNEAKYNGPLNLQAQRSMETTVLMMTSNSQVSPVLDLQRTNATVSRNLVDNPSAADGLYGTPTKTVTFGDDIAEANLLVGQSVTFTTGLQSYSTSVNEINLTTRKVKFKGQNVSYLSSSSVFSDVTLAEAGILKLNNISEEEFKPETDNSGSVFSKWISRLFLFENSSDGIELKLACILYDVENVKVYFRPKPVGYDNELSDINWIPFNGTGLCNDSDKVKPRSSSNVDPRGLKAGEWQSLTWSAQDIPSFDGLQVKVVMTSDNPAQAPLIDDIQLVTSE